MITAKFLFDDHQVCPFLAHASSMVSRSPASSSHRGESMALGAGTGTISNPDNNESSGSAGQLERAAIGRAAHGWRKRIFEYYESGYSSERRFYPTRASF
jgi:hypothetical protein